MSCSISYIIFFPVPIGYSHQSVFTGNDIFQTCCSGICLLQCNCHIRQGICRLRRIRCIEFNRTRNITVRSNRQYRIEGRCIINAGKKVIEAAFRQCDTVYAITGSILIQHVVLLCLLGSSNRKHIACCIFRNVDCIVFSDCSAIIDFGQTCQTVDICYGFCSFCKFNSCYTCQSGGNIVPGSILECAEAVIGVNCDWSIIFVRIAFTFNQYIIRYAAQRNTVRRFKGKGHCIDTVFFSCNRINGTDRVTPGKGVQAELAAAGDFFRGLVFDAPDFECCSIVNDSAFREG